MKTGCKVSHFFAQRVIDVGFYFICFASRKDYKGCTVEYPKYLTLQDVETFQASHLDIPVCAFPKTGNYQSISAFWMLRELSPN